MINVLRRAALRTALMVAAVVAVFVASIALSPDGSGHVLAGDPLGSGGEYHQLTPTRILDTREAELDFAPFGPRRSDVKTADTVFEVPVLDVPGLPGFQDTDEDGFDDNVLAVVVNITVIDPTRSGYLKAFPAGVAESDTSVVNFLAGTTVPNTAVIRPGADGQIAIRLVTPTAPGTADVAIDISGWFSTSTYDRGARLIPISPIRAYDSDLAQFGGSTLAGRSQTRVPVLGAVDATAPGDAIPDDPNIVGVVANITGVNTYTGSRWTYISALPEAVPAGGVPSTSTVNLLPGQIKANLAILPIGDDGSIQVFNYAGEIRLVVDIVGYLLEGEPVDSSAGRVIPLVGPFRAFDTREPLHKKTPLGPARSESWSFDSFVNDVTIGGAWVGDQVGLIGNLTATDLQRQYPSARVVSYMTAYPTPASGPATPPEVSNLNIFEGDTVANLALLRYGGNGEDSHMLQFYNRAGYVDYLLDVYAVVLAE